MSSWWQTRIWVPSQLAEGAAWLLAEALDHPVEMQDETTMERGDSPQSVALVIGFDHEPDESFPDLLRGVMDQLGYVGDLTPETRRRDDDAWQNGWKAFFKGVQLSPRIWAGPPWEAPPKHLEPVFIEPGLAFGTGTHPTTAGAMAMLDKLLGSEPPQHILDVGCGSAILSIGAARLGHRATGCEIDPIAARNGRENVDRNGLANRVQVITGSAEDVEGDFELVVANIIAPVLVEIADPIQQRARRKLILSGLLRSQEEMVINAYNQFQLLYKVEHGEWLVLQLEART